MRWALALCVLATAVAHHGATADPRGSDRAVYQHPRAAVVLLAEVRPENERAVIAESHPPKTQTPKAQRTKPEQVHPSIAMLGESGVVRGVIVDETGAPIAKAKIAGMYWRTGWCGRGRFTAALQGYGRDGTFVLRYVASRPGPGLPPGMEKPEPDPKITFTVEAVGYVDQQVEWTSEVSAAVLRGESVGQQTIVLQRGAAVEGVVVGPNGKLAAKIWVGAVDDPLALMAEPGTSVRTDAQGRFRIADLDPRRKLWLFANHGEAIMRPIALRILSADAVSHYTVELEVRRRVTVTIAPPVSGEIVRVTVDGRIHPPLIDGVCVVWVFSGPHRFKVRCRTSEGIQTVTIKRWIGPHQDEHFERVRFNQD